MNEFALDSVFQITFKQQGLFIQKIVLFWSPYNILGSNWWSLTSHNQGLCSVEVNISKKLGIHQLLELFSELVCAKNEGRNTSQVCFCSTFWMETCKIAQEWGIIVHTYRVPLPHSWTWLLARKGLDTGRTQVKVLTGRQIYNFLTVLQKADLLNFSPLHFQMQIWKQWLI